MMPIHLILRGCQHTSACGVLWSCTYVHILCTGVLMPYGDKQLASEQTARRSVCCLQVYIQSPLCAAPPHTHLT